MNEVITSIDTGWKKYQLTIKGVKAWECPECGEKVYDSEEVDMIQDLCEGFSLTSAEQQPDALNVEEVADLLRVSSQTVYNMIKDGRLRATKIGREWRFMRKNIESALYPDDRYQVVARDINGENLECDKEILLRHLKQM